MKLYRWLSRGYHDERIVEPSEEVLCADSVIPGAHMVDVAAESAAILARQPLPEPVIVEQQPVFRADLAHSAGMPIAPPIVVTLPVVDPVAPVEPVAAEPTLPVVDPAPSEA